MVAKLIYASFMTFTISNTRFEKRLYKLKWRHCLKEDKKLQFHYLRDLWNLLQSENLITYKRTGRAYEHHVPARYEIKPTDFRFSQKNMQVVLGKSNF